MNEDSYHGMYRLVGKVPVPCKDAHEWAQAWKEDRRVARTQINPEVSVSTVFLGLDHNFDVEDEIPVLFETMIFGGKEDQFQSRCHTWEEAEVMHENACELAREAE